MEFAVDAKNGVDTALVNVGDLTNKLESEVLHMFVCISCQSTSNLSLVCKSQCASAEWDILPSEIAKKLIHGAFCDDKPCKVNHLMQLRLTNKEFASTLYPFVQVYNPDHETQMKSILSIIASFFKSHPFHSKFGMTDYGVQQRAFIYSFLYSVVYAHCTRKSANSSAAFYSMLSCSEFTNEYVIAMMEADAINFKKLLIRVFKYLDRFYVKRFDLDTLDKLMKIE
jgi:hypothetical protein